MTHILNKHTAKLLITGVAGFIGMHTAQYYLEAGYQVVGLDNLNDYYSPKLKNYRLNQLTPYANFKFIKLDLINREGIDNLFKTEDFTHVIHLAAQAGVRYSIENPYAYLDSNLAGMLTILEACRHYPVEHLVYASSSSVYGMNASLPFSETDQVDNPVSLYAATKKANELMAHSYSKLYQLPTTGLRFFTVYGPAGRPDMAPWLFTEAILKGKPIKVFNQGKMQRDFTYIDDIVEGIVRITAQPLLVEQEPIPYQIYNIGNNESVELSRFIKAIEFSCGKSAKKTMLDMQPGDVIKTYADISKLEKKVGYRPKVEVEEGIEKFVSWYKKFNSI